MNIKKLSSKKIEELKRERKIKSLEKYKLGGAIVQIKDWCGHKKGRTGWVIGTWPHTTILFEDGRELSVLRENCNSFKALDIFLDAEELDDMIEDITSRSTSQTKVKRKDGIY